MSVAKLAIKAIKTYQVFSKSVLRVSPLFFVYQSNCRFYPTCSDYTIEAINKHGFWTGVNKGFLRIIKCNPFTKILNK